MPLHCILGCDIEADEDQGLHDVIMQPIRAGRPDGSAVAKRVDMRGA